MLDIYTFINSDAIRKHLRDMDFKFNTLEAAWLVFQSMDTTVEERHAAWLEIVDTMPDCELPERNNAVHQDSVHEFLKRYIAIENDVLKKFHQPDSKAIYQFKFYCKGDVTWCGDYECAYATEEECWDMIAEDMDLGIHSVKIRKMGLGKDAPWVTIEFKPDKSVVCIQDYGLLADADKAIINESFEGLWFDFPIPFEKGDVLARHIPEYPAREINRPYPFVMAGATPLQSEERKKQILEYGDNTDMNAWGWFQEEDGRIFHEVMGNYMDLEYYDGPFEGVTRLLKAISSYIKEEIPLDLLLTCYRKVILDEITRDINLNMYLDKDLEKAGLSDVAKGRNSYLSTAKVTIIGIGGAGVGVVEKLFKKKIEDVQYIAADTEWNRLKEPMADVYITMGGATTGNESTNGDVSLGEKSARFCEADFAYRLQNSKIAIIVCGLGGGTGTGAAAIVAKAAKKMGCYTIGVVSIPFSFESNQCHENAKGAIAEIGESVDQLSMTFNDLVLNDADNELTTAEAYQLALKRLTEIVEDTLKDIEKGRILK